MHELAPGIFVETGFRRVNVGAILTSEGFVLIDTPPFAEDARRWRSQLMAIAAQPVRAIINTDGHRDRILGDCWFPDAVIVAQENTIDHVKNLPGNFVDTAAEELAYLSFERSAFSAAHVRVPDIGFSQRMQLRFGDRVIPLISKPGPMAGSLWVHLPEEQILFAGDSVVVNQHPYLSNPSTKLWLENLTVMRRSRFPVKWIVPGRGPLIDKRATEPLSNYLRLARRRVHSLYRAGRPRADTAVLVSELLELFPYDQANVDELQRRIKAGLDRIYDEFKAADKESEL